MFSIENSEKRFWERKEEQEERLSIVPSLKDNTMHALPSKVISSHHLIPSLKCEVGWE